MNGIITSLSISLVYKTIPNAMLLAAVWRKRLLWILSSMSLATLLLLYYVQQTQTPLFIAQNEFFHYDLNKEEPLLPDQTCQLPRVHPFDPSILNYLSPPKSIKCKERKGDLTFVDGKGVLRFNLSSVNSHGYVVEELHCDYKEIIRKTDFEIEYSDVRKISVDGSRLLSDFAYVSCYNFAGIAFYTNIHCHILPKMKFPNSEKVYNLNDAYNVLIFGIDSLSRLSFIRQLPRTYKFLIKKLGAFVFRGMTKVGDNTFPNLAAVLTGKSVFDNELPRVVDPIGTYDDWPCLWKNFSEAGYVTLFAEDQPDIGLFNYLRGGLRDSPTDHYMRPFWLAVQTSKRYRLSSNLCFGSIPKHILQLKYVRNFMEEYRKAKRPFFAFSFLVELSHDYVNQVTSADIDLESWLQDMYNSGYLNNTFLFFMSDHGHRFDAMRATLIGRIEERMPFFSLVLPTTFHSSPNEMSIVNLRRNQGRLTTPYDIYFTALDVLHFSFNKSLLGSTTSNRGTSLFGYISSNRTCPVAGIPDHYCVCEVEEEVEISDSRPQRAAQMLISHINHLVSPYGNYCSQISLVDILRADMIVPPRKVVVNSRLYFGNLVEDGEATGMMSRFRVIIRTAPGHALFEGTLQLRDDDRIVTVLGDISRINHYGDQSSCIDDPVLRKYCICRNLNLTNSPAVS